MRGRVAVGGTPNPTLNGDSFDIGKFTFTNALAGIRSK
jgi:hypothetical protein